MPGLWRWGVALAAFGTCWGTGGARAEAPARALSAAAAVASMAPPASTLPPASTVAEVAGEPAAPAVADLTPPAWPTDPITRTVGQYPIPGHLSPTAPHDGGAFANLELLVMRPRRGAFDYAIDSPNNGLATAGELRSLNYEFRAGVKTTIGYRFDDSAWDVLFAYTYLRSSTNESIFAGPNGVILPTLTRPGLVDQATAAQATSTFLYDVFDLELGRRFAVDDHLALRLFGGLRFASIRQTLTATYDGLDARSARVDNKSNFDGFGPIFGGEAVWACWRGFHLYARGAGGLLTGQVSNPLVEANDGGATTYANVDFTARKVVPMASLGLGGGWQYRQFSVRLGYEITNYFGLINQPRFVDDVSRGKVTTSPSDLSLEGLFTQVGFSF